jgi:quinoprotein glucose dehydrogenase
VTAGGLVFIAATLDRRFRAYDIETGRVLWAADLPAGGKATPMTYSAGGRQYVVIAAGGGGRFGRGDAIVAFALPK